MVETLSQVVTVQSLEDWFRKSVSGAMEHRHVHAQADTEHYMVRLLTSYARAENLYEHGPDGRYAFKPLAKMLAEAFEARSLEERHHAFKRIGDVALFIAGFFSESFARKPVDVDYYSRMGGSAYGTLSTLPAPSVRESALARVFAELAHKFAEFVDVLNEVAQQAKVFDERDLLRLYELWVRTGSPRAAEKLRALGLEPAVAARTAFTH